MAAANLFEEVELFEQRLGVPKNFFKHLLEEDDWSFVIKLSALFEACMHAHTCQKAGCAGIRRSLRKPGPRQRQLWQDRDARSLRRCAGVQAGFLRELASLRNTLVHNISNVAFSFDHHIRGLSEEKLKAFTKIFGRSVSDVVQGAKLPFTPKAIFVKDNPKLAIWMTAADVLACLHLEIELKHVSGLETLAKHAEMMLAQSKT